MADLSTFDPNSVGNPDNNIFGLPFSEDDAQLIIFPVPWEVTVSYGKGTARCFESVFDASLQIDLYNQYYKNTWQRGFHMLDVNKKILTKSDYLRKEAELYVDCIAKGDDVEGNNFICKSIKEINEGSQILNQYVYDNTKALLEKGKIVGLLGGDHSCPLGYMKALSEKHGEFGILQIDAHCDLRVAYEDFTYSHASIMYNALTEIKQITQLTQVGIRDYCEEEYQFIQQNKERVTTFFDEDIKEQSYQGKTWHAIVEAIVQTLPQKVYISYDIDGLDPKLCPNTGTPVNGGFEVEQINYLFKKVIESGRTIIGFDLVEIGHNADTVTDANVGARVLWHLCNLTLMSQPK